MTLQWLPRRADWRGILLAACLGGAALTLVRVLPPTAWISDILIALLLGTTVLNTPLRKPLSLALPSPERQPDRYASGLRYTGKWVLRLGIILMGLKVQTGFFGGLELALVVGVLLVVIPSAYLMAHALGAWLGVRGPLVDLVGIGTMICGASAVNAAAPVVQARRDEQGISIGVVFLFSIIAMLSYRPLAMWLELSPRMAGLWAGLAVNDLSSAVAVGKQMGEGGAVMAAAAKSARILTLAPILVLLSLRERRNAAGNVSAGVMATLPKFILGYVVLAVARALGDRLYAGAAWWSTVLWLDDVLVDLMLCTVAAAIGLHLGLRKLFASGGRAIAVGGGASVWMASIALLMITSAARGATTVTVLVGVAALSVSAAVYRMTRGEAHQLRALRKRFEAGDGLSLGEAAKLLQGELERERFDQTLCERVMKQLQPSIGELIPVRETPMADGENCRWTPYWVGDNGWTLGAILRSPGSATKIHDHPQAMIGKAIEGEIEEYNFEVDGQNLRLASIEQLTRNQVNRHAAASGPHLIRVTCKTSAIDLQLRGPAGTSSSREFHPLAPFDPEQLKAGDHLLLAMPCGAPKAER